MIENSAQNEANRAQESIESCIGERRSFVLEAAAGAGKTYSLVETLSYLLSGIDVENVTMPSIACITYTKVARDEIRSRIDNHPAVLCETLHSFCWQLIKNFQKDLRLLVECSDKWEKVRDASPAIEAQSVQYELGFRRIRDDQILLHHDDVINLTIELLQRPKFKAIIRSRFPVILIDEYQDTDSKLVQALQDSLFGPAGTLPVFGLFGDHWQRIYGQGCGKVNDPRLRFIEKKVNFRSSPALIQVFNRIRPEHEQIPARADKPGKVEVFHCNDWKGERRSDGHWKGDLPADEIQKYMRRVRHALASNGWFSTAGDSKILMLTHRLLAAEQGYPTFPSIFRRNESFSDLEDAHLSYFVDQLEPAREFFEARRYGAMYEALGLKAPIVRSSAEKVAIHASMASLVNSQKNGTVGEVVDFLRSATFPRLPPSVLQREIKLQENSRSDEPLTSSLESLQKLRDVPYSEVRSLAHASGPTSSYSTKHGVKGAEFDDVLVVATGGWNQYNWNEMLKSTPNTISTMSDRQLAAYERSRNLFYVACTRAKARLAILFTQRLDDEALARLQDWFGVEGVSPAP